ncbi:hypothetical protein J2Z47_005738 [Cohnella thailandensis]|nr:hypothetical protein [Cohnella thailandensis]
MNLAAARSRLSPSGSSIFGVTCENAANIARLLVRQGVLRLTRIGQRLRRALCGISVHLGPIGAPAAGVARNFRASWAYRRSGGGRCAENPCISGRSALRRRALRGNSVHLGPICAPATGVVRKFRVSRADRRSGGGRCAKNPCISGRSALRRRALRGNSVHLGCGTTCHAFARFLRVSANVWYHVPLSEGMV